MVLMEVPDWDFGAPKVAKKEKQVKPKPAGSNQEKTPSEPQHRQPKAQGQGNDPKGSHEKGHKNPQKNLQNLQKGQHKEQKNQQKEQKNQQNRHVDEVESLERELERLQERQLKKIQRGKERKDRERDSSPPLPSLLGGQGKKRKRTEEELPRQPQPQVKKPKVESQQSSSLSTLQQKMKDKLSGARFRWINEQLYTTESTKAYQSFQEDPSLFDVYHEGFRTQVESWPQNPVDIFIDFLKTCPSNTTVADFGCGEAKIAATLHKKIKTIHSFDLVAANKFITACDISHVPLEHDCVDIAIFCLSLMGTNFLDFVKEAHRVLKPGGSLKIAEVVSRFTDIDAFVKALNEIGFKLTSKDASNKVFILFDFEKRHVDKKLQQQLHKNVQEVKSGMNPQAKSKNLTKNAGSQPQDKKKKEASLSSSSSDKGKLLLKPCLYKKR